MEQEQYDLWVRTTSANLQDIFCGGHQISKNEHFFIDNYAKKCIVDIGCGTGHRTFPVWIGKNLIFYGIEKFQNLIDASDYNEKIVLADIGEGNFKDIIPNLQGTTCDIAFLFGGVINGLLTNELRTNAWKNFRLILNSCNYILIDTLTHFKWFNVAEKGKIMQLHPSFPVQYFYSEKELKALCNANGIEILTERSEEIGNFLIRTQYLLKLKKELLT